MATYYAINAGGNWSAGATWSTVSAKDASRVGGSTAPTNADDCILDDYSGNVTVNTTTCACKSITCTGYTGTLTFTAAQRLIVSGDVVFSAGMALAGTGDLRFQATATLNMAGLTFPGSMSNNTSGTITLLADLVITGALTATNALLTFAGAFDVTCSSLRLYYGLIIPSGQTLTITESITLMASIVTVPTIKSSTASSTAYLTYQGTVANCAIAGYIFTDIDASGSAQGLDNWYGGTLTRTAGITNRTSADIGGGGSPRFGDRTGGK
jgi:hypothetical protein